MKHKPHVYVDRDQVRAYMRAGLNNSEIAKIIGCAKSTVSTYRSLWGFGSRNKYGRSFDNHGDPLKTIPYGKLANKGKHPPFPKRCPKCGADRANFRLRFLRDDYHAAYGCILCATYIWVA